LSTAVLALISGKFDTAFPYSLTVPLLRDVKSQMAQANDYAGAPLAGLRIAFSSLSVHPRGRSPIKRQASALIDSERILITGGGKVRAYFYHSRY
jgi:hypothetical protein